MGVTATTARRRVMAARQPARERERKPPFGNDSMFSLMVGKIWRIDVDPLRGKLQDYTGNDGLTRPATRASYQISGPLSRVMRTRSRQRYSEIMELQVLGSVAP